MSAHLLSAFALACAAFAQPPAFEVASVKPSEPITPAMVQSGRLNIGVAIDATHVRISKLSLSDLVRLAYQIKFYQYSGPAWMNQERYDIQAALPAGAKRAQVPAMLQTLLAERFHLAIHRETRELSVYALVVARDGHRLKPAADQDPAAPAPPAGQLRGGATVSGGATISTGPGGNSRVIPGPGGNQHVETVGMTLPAFTDLLNRYAGRPVIDQTGIQGRYDMEFDVSGEELRNAARGAGVVIPPPASAAPGASPAEAATDPAGVSLFTSIQRLGLKLEPRKAPVEVIVIDHAEKMPTEN